MQSPNEDGVGERAAFLRRRNSIATSVVVPAKPTGKNPKAYSFPNGGGKPAPLDSYTSLKDILPPAAADASAADVGSSTANSRSPIVKQAAWDNLRRTSSSQRCSGDGFLRRLWVRFSGPVNACLGFISRAVDRILRTVLVGSTR